MIYFLLSIIIIQSITILLLGRFILKNFQLVIEDITQMLIDQQVNEFEKEVGLINDEP